jgi:hypothetical protein
MRLYNFYITDYFLISNNLLDAQFVFCEVGTESLYIVYMASDING